LLSKEKNLKSTIDEFRFRALKEEGILKKDFPTTPKVIR